MKRLTSLLLVFMLLLSMTACIIETKPNDDDNTDQTQNEIKESHGTSGANASTDTTDTESINTGSTDTESTGTESTDNNNGNKTIGDEISFTEVAVVDNDECSIKISNIDPNNMWGYTLKVLLENKSSEKTYMFSVESASINGVECDPFFATEVAPSKKSNTEINFSNEELDKNVVGDYTDIELSFRVYDSNDWTADEVAKETVHIYPYGEDKAVKYVREDQASDNVIVDNEYVTVIVTGYEHDSIWGYSVNLFLLNKTDKEVMFSVDEASVNGFMADPFYAKSVKAGKCAFSSMSWSDSTFEENSITEVEDIEFKLRVYNAEDWFDSDLVNETITLNP